MKNKIEEIEVGKIKVTVVNPEKYKIHKIGFEWEKKMIFICGMCIIEGEQLTYDFAKHLKEIVDKYDVNFYFKASFDKANRTDLDSYRGTNVYEGVKILRRIKDGLGVKILTDVHHPHQADIVAGVADIIQIPAFLCRQTDLVLRVGQAGKGVNIKKGQFLAPEDMKHIIKKVESTGNKNIFVTERGRCFGYGDLIVDYRSFLIMKKLCPYPIIYDVTHSLQQPSGKQTGGTREFALAMAKGAIATGAVDGLFVESHFNPPKAKSDKGTSLYLKDIDNFLREIMKIWEVINHE